MKSSLIALILIFFMASACEKESSVQLQGRWNLVHVVIGGQSYDYTGIMEFNDDFTFSVIDASGLINEGQYTLSDETVLTFYYNDPTHQPVEIYDIILLAGSELILEDREYMDRYELER